MKYLIVNSDDNETFYELADIDKIVSDYAMNLFSESDLRGNDIKPIEMLTVIRFNNNSTDTFTTSNLEMYFE